MKAIPNQESREFRHYHVIVRHPKTEQSLSIWCWLREADLNAAHAGMIGVQDWILQVITSKFRWDPNKLRLHWDDVSFPALRAQPARVLRTS